MYRDIATYNPRAITPRMVTNALRCTRDTKRDIGRPNDRPRLRVSVIQFLRDRVSGVYRSAEINLHDVRYTKSPKKWPVRLQRKVYEEVIDYYQSDEYCLCCQRVPPGGQWYHDFPSRSTVSDCHCWPIVVNYEVTNRRGAYINIPAGIGRFFEIFLYGNINFSEDCPSDDDDIDIDGSFWRLCYDANVMERVNTGQYAYSCGRCAGLHRAIKTPENSPESRSLKIYDSCVNNYSYEIIDVTTMRR